jgi:bacterioferritin-associated ferredoxin
VPLLVCHCHRICDRTIRESIREGARSIDEVGASCGAGTGCGGCRPAIAGLLAARGQQSGPSSGLAERPRRALTVLEPFFAFPLAS